MLRTLHKLEKIARLSKFNESALKYLTELKDKLNKPAHFKGYTDDVHEKLIKIQNNSNLGSPIKQVVNTIILNL